MAKTYTVTVTDTEDKALQTVCADVTEWINHVASHNAEVAINDIVDKNTKHCNTNGIAIGVGITAQVDQALNLGITTTSQVSNSTATAPG
tara:strand:+ start:1313 stop:1582 length:270 start_codon:yes stop_codon:yes gene_type:complete